MTHDKNMILCIAPNGYQIDLLAPSIYNEMVMEAEMNGQSIDQSECRSYGEDLTEQQIEDLHTRIIFDVRYADGTVTQKDMEDVGFEYLGEVYTFYGEKISLFMGFGLKVEINKYAKIHAVYSEELDKFFTIKTLPDLIRLTKFLET